VLSVFQTDRRGTVPLTLHDLINERIEE
jgi:hypothetical protein